MGSNCKLVSKDKSLVTPAHQHSTLSHSTCLKTTLINGSIITLRRNSSSQGTQGNREARKKRLSTQTVTVLEATRGKLSQNYEIQRETSRRENRANRKLSVKHEESILFIEVHILLES